MALYDPDPLPGMLKKMHINLNIKQNYKLPEKLVLLISAIFNLTYSPGYAIFSLNYQTSSLIQGGDSL
jgi:hypothetical protein